MRIITALANFSTAILVLTGPASATEAGFRVEAFHDELRDRPIMLDWWYPVENQPAEEFNYGLGRGRLVEAGKIAKGSFPLVLLSHGAFGSARNYSWIAEHLARSGYLVAGISHFGESYVYGADTIDPSAVLRWWQRPTDVTAALSFITTDSKLANYVDAKRIAFIGHSSGGATAMSLAGVVFDDQKMGDYCKTKAANADRGCDYADVSGPHPPKKAIQSTKTDFSDPRIQTFVALDPALGPGFSDFTEVDITIRMLIVGSVQNDFLPFAHHAEHLAKNLPTAKRQWLDNGAGHFIYLDECSLELAANGISLCSDRSGTSRNAVHKMLAGVISDFLSGRLHQ